tara:strand:+ start:86 stop:484 length:399 start_codon:yes stop_codon:yes gene_type:complete
MNNLISFLGGFKRNNPEWAGEIGNWAGEKGISVRRPLGNHIWNDRAFTLGNTVFIPEGAEKAWGDIDVLIKEELPHVAQWREEGMLGFLGKHIWDLLKHGAGQKTYDIKDTHESYHYTDPEERTRLMGILGK